MNLASLRGFFRLWLAETLALWAGRLDWSCALDTLIEDARTRKHAAHEAACFAALSRVPTLDEVFPRGARND